MCDLRPVTCLTCVCFLIGHARSCLNTPPPALPTHLLLYPLLFHAITFIATWHICVCPFVCSLSDTLHWNWRSVSARTYSHSPNTCNCAWHTIKQSIVSWWRAEWMDEWMENEIEVSKLGKISIFSDAPGRPTIVRKQKRKKPGSLSQE